MGGGALVGVLAALLGEGLHHFAQPLMHPITQGREGGGQHGGCLQASMVAMLTRLSWGRGGGGVGRGGTAGAGNIQLTHSCSCTHCAGQG